MSLVKKFAQGYPQKQYLTRTVEDNFLGVLNEHAPLKKKVLRANHAPFLL